MTQLRRQTGRLREIIGAARGRTGMAAIEDDGDVRFVLRQLGKQGGQFLVGQIEATGTAAVVTDQSLVHAAGIELLEGLGRFPLGAMAAVLEDNHVVRLGLAQVRAELPDDVGPRGVRIFENFDTELAPVKVLRQVAVEMVDVVEATAQLPNVWRIVIDTHQQREDAIRHQSSPDSPTEAGTSII